jgi:thiol:disulfide interchange protein DsbA
MLRNFYRTIFLLTFALASFAQASEWKEGQHYTELPFPLQVETGNKIEVREFFWYGCPHCNNLEPTVTRWLKQKPANAQLVRSPAMLGASWEPHAVTYFTYEALGIVDKMHTATFRAIHEDKKVLKNIDQIADFVAGHGVNRDKFLSASRSFGVRLKVQHQKKLDADANINSVPTFLIDGRYRTGEGEAGGKEQLMQLINYLVNKAQQERKKK